MSKFPLFIRHRRFHLWGLIGLSRRKCLWLIFSAFFSAAAALLNAAAIGLLFRLLRGMLNKPSTEHQTLVAVILAFILVVLIKNFMIYASGLCLVRQTAQITAGLRSLIFQRYMQFGKLFFDRRSVWKLSTALTRFPQAIGMQLNALQRLFMNSLTVLTYGTIMVFISWKISLWTLAIFVPFIYLTRRVTRNAKLEAKHHLVSEERLEKKIFNVLSAIPLVKTQNMARREKALFEDLSDEELRLNHALEKKEKLVLPFQDFCMMCAFLLLAVAVILFLPGSTSEHLPHYVIFIYVLRLSLPGIASINQALINLDKAENRIHHFSDILDNKDKYIIPEGASHFAGLKNHIEFRNISFAYRPKRRVLKNVCLRIEKGKLTALVGPTGAGKTTLAHLLLRFYDCPPNSILADGMDIRDFTLESYCAHFAYVSQETLLFNDTLRANMAYGKKGEVSDEALMEAARKARLDGFIRRLPEGLDTPVGDRGVRLSGGQKQRVAIARAILQDADILILDEATSALDSKTEALIQEALSEIIQDKTTIVIAHRLSTIKKADKIAVLEDGVIAEEGNLDELLAKKGRFCEYWNAQKFY